MSHVVSTSYGQLQGEPQDSVLAFRGIPFAAPPVGPNRFRPPQRAAAWDGVRDATKFGPAALQVESPVSQALAMQVSETSEDCLYLNVWTPSLEGSRPVMVWIHGGAFVIGAGSQDLYDGARLAARGDVVVVTVNYRLGLFGFLHGRSACGDALDTSGNEGILDQAAALRWVHEEVAAFGGDPGNVTIFGESAGSISVAALLGMPAAKGLFHKVILQSGAANLIGTAEGASATTLKLLEHFELLPVEAGKLRDLPAEDLLKAQTEVTPRTAGVAYGPVVDGDVLPRSTLDVVAGGGAAGIPMLIGTMLDEMKLFAFLDPSVLQLEEADLAARVEPFAPGRASTLIETYRAAREARGELVTPFELYEAVATDATMRVPSTKLAALHAAHTPGTYSYLFTYPSPSLGGMLGSCHALDLPFVFGSYGLEAMQSFAGEGPAVEKLSGQVQDAWLAFARTGSPSSESLPAWPPYDAARRATMIFDVEPRVENAPREPERAAWE